MEKLIAMKEITLEDLKKEIDELKKQFVIDKLEDFCTMLKCAVTSLNLQLPSLVSFERYLNKLTDINDIFYVMDLIHQCVIFIYPSSLFVRPVKKWESYSKEELNALLSNSIHYQHLSEEVYRGNYSGLSILHYNAFKELDSSIQQVYRLYMKGLYVICKNVCMKHNMELTEMFTVPYELKSELNLSESQIERVYEAVVSTGKLKKDNDEYLAFKSLFGLSKVSIEQHICWYDVSKNGNPNYVTLYTMFETMGVDMNDFNRKIICNVFVTTKGAIEPDQLRPRRTNISYQLNDFKEKINSALK